MTDVPTRISAAKLWLTAAGGGGSPYLSSAVYAMPTIVTDRVAQISADESWRVYVNEEWALGVEVPVLGAHLAHLVWHLLRDHAARARSMGVGRRESKAWAKAADCTVAETLAAGGHALGELTGPKAHGLPGGLAVEEYYALIDRLSAVSSGGEVGESCPCGSAADGLPRGYEVPGGETGVDEVRAQQLREHVAIEFQAHMSGRGDQAGEWARWVEQVLEPKVPWQQVLQSSVRRAVAWRAGTTHATYRRISRRQAATTAILPGMQRPVPAVAIVVDTSGSMDDGLLAQALGEVDGVLRSLGTSVGGVEVFSCDAAAHAAGKVSSARDITLVGGGGTDLRVGIDLAMAARPRPELLVVLTDGDTPWPHLPPPGCTVIAVLITRGHEVACPAWAVRVDCCAA